MSRFTVGTPELLKISGCSRILGIAISDRRARIVELAQRGLPIPGKRRKIEPVQAVTCDFTQNSTPEEKAEVLRSTLATEGVTAHYAVLGVECAGLKVVSATVPVPLGETEEWITDHLESLLKLPISLSIVSFRYEVLKLQETDSQVEITFFRLPDLEEYKHISRSAGLELLSVTGGNRDSLNSLAAQSDRRDNLDYILFCATDENVSIFPVQNGQRQPSKSYALSEALFDFGVLQDAAGLGDLALRYVAGERVERLIDGECVIVEPFGFDTRYTLASGLAIKGLSPEVSPVDFLTKDERALLHLGLYKRTLKRVTLFLGMTLVLLLTLELASSSVLESKIESMEEAKVARSDDYTRVEALARRVGRLEHETRGSESVLKGSGASRAMHDIASALPESLWFSRLEIALKTENERKLIVSGFAPSSRQVSGFLRKLESGPCTDARLIRSGEIGEIMREIPVPPGTRSYVGFDVSGNLRRE